MWVRSVVDRGPLIATFVACGAFLWASCGDDGNDEATTRATTAEDDTATDESEPVSTNSPANDETAVGDAVAASNPCASVTHVALETTMPTSFDPGSQLNADCIAWQQFIYLNWLADPTRPGHPDPNTPPTSFGTPGDTSATVWESYLEANQVFGDGEQEAVAEWMVERPDVKPLGRRSKVDDTELGLSDIAQAGDNKWLTDQRGNLVFYEVKINEDEHDYIHTNGLTTAAGQAACAMMAGGFDLPRGTDDKDCAGNPATYGQGFGAIELKAAWVELPEDGSLDHRYKIAVADLTLPDGTTEPGVTVGLVGLHIIHKMEGAEQFLWSTFEHIDNAPDDNGGNPGPPALPSNPNVTDPPPPYTFFDTDCDPSTDHYGCEVNKLPGEPCTAPNTPAGCDPYTAPMQVTRYFSVPSSVPPAVAYPVTGYAWTLLPADSVFNYYRLIDVQWPQNSMKIAPGATAPLSPGSIQSETFKPDNTTMETFQQRTNDCMSCHQYAHVAVPQTQACNSGECLASDYSFVFSVETQE